MDVLTELFCMRHPVDIYHASENGGMIFMHGILVSIYLACV
jgi:hypothetical protein